MQVTEIFGFFDSDFGTLMSLEYFCVLNSVQLVSGLESIGSPRYFSLMMISVIFLSLSPNIFSY